MLLEDTEGLSGSPRKRGKKKKDAAAELFPEPAECRSMFPKYDWVGSAKLPKIKSPGLSIREITVDGDSSNWYDSYA